MIKYHAWSIFGEIEKREILRETDKCVFFASPYAKNGRREDKLSEGQGYFDTFEEARRYLIEIEQRKIVNLRNEISMRQDRIAKIQELTE